MDLVGVQPTVKYVLFETFNDTAVSPIQRRYPAPRYLLNLLPRVYALSTLEGRVMLPRLCSSLGVRDTSFTRFIHVVCALRLE